MNNIAEFLTKNLITNAKSIAIREENRYITYSELFTSSYELSIEIRKSVQSEYPEPILVESQKKIETIIALFAVIFSGNIYCPYDKELNQEKKERLNSKLGAKIKIDPDNSDTDHLSNLLTLKSVISEKEIDFEEAMLELSSFLKKNVISTDPCYIIHTSGSTGQPKGVTITHAGVIDYINWINSIFDFNKNDNFGSQAPFIFDNSTLDIYASFSVGASLCLIPKNVLSQPLKLMEYIAKHNVTVIFWVPSLYIFLEKFKAMKHKILLKSLRWCLFAGEVMPNNTLTYWKDNLKKAKFANLYGPTEITVDCTYYIVPDDYDLDEVPIGIQCENSKVLIIDSDNKISDRGELIVRGIGNSVGYWNNEDQTKEKFIQNPLHNNFHDICYRTGDLVERKDGLIYFKGRNDDQIKFQGHRIELGEIENNLIEIEEINNVVCGFDQKKQIIWAAYEGKIEEKTLLDILRIKLQGYMIPKKFISIDQLPALPNGKIDRSKIKTIIEK